VLSHKSKQLEAISRMLRGQKTLLRAITRDDLERLWQFNNDVEVELAGGGDPPIPQSLARLQVEYENDLAKGGRDGARFAIVADEKCIGQCALFNFNETAQTCELGITIGDKAYWGRGYGRDAIQSLLDYAFRLRNLRRVHLSVNGNNQGAIKAYKSCGFIEEGCLRAHVWSNGEYIDLVIMGLLREEWLKSKRDSK
jgi:RimJ/RimL family protein N-acetyltransferase